MQGAPDVFGSVNAADTLGDVSPDVDWSPAEGTACSVCAATVAVLSDAGTCPLCWATDHAADPDHTVGQALAVEALWLLDVAPHRVANCIERLRNLAEHASRPSVTAVLSDAARDLEMLAAQ